MKRFIALTFYFLLLTNTALCDTNSSSEIVLVIENDETVTCYVKNMTNNVYDADFKVRGYPKITDSFFIGEKHKSGNKFDFGFGNRSGGGGGPGIEFWIGHAKYRIKIDGNYIYVDFRDCQYSEKNVDYYRTSDLYLKYDPDDEKFYVQDGRWNNDTWYHVPNGNTIGIWDYYRKYVSGYYPTSCFGNPSPPTGLWHQKVPGSGGYENPKLMWDAHEGYDFDDYYQIHRKMDTDNWSVIANTSETYYIDPHVKIKSPNKLIARYKLKARDWGNLMSGFSSVHLVSYNSGLGKYNDPNSMGEMEIEDEEEINKFKLLSPSPNPFNPQTNISFVLPEPANVNITIYDILGEAIDFINLDNLATGLQELQWSGADAPSGMYLMYFEAIGINSGKVYSDNNKLHLLK